MSGFFPTFHAHHPPHFFTNSERPRTARKKAACKTDRLENAQASGGKRRYFHATLI